MSVSDDAGLCGGTRNHCETPNLAALAAGRPVAGPASLTPGRPISIHQGGHYGGPRAAPVRGEPLLEGLVDVAEVAPGLVLRRVDARDLQGAAVRAPLRVGLHIALVIGGRVRVDVGEHQLALGPDGSRGVRGVMLSCLQPGSYLRQSHRGDIERSVALTMTSQWLASHLGPESGAAPEDFLRTHLAPRTWQASGQAVALAEQMLRAPVLPLGLWRLYQKSRALDLAVEALTHLQGEAAADRVALGSRDRRRMLDLRAWLDSGQADALALSEIACRACVSVNTLQRHFRAMWGTTVAQYLRDGRLDRARLALARDGISVTDAAELAGYGSAANFATAFRRRYGVSPGQLRSRSDGGAE